MPGAQFQMVFIQKCLLLVITLRRSFGFVLVKSFEVDFSSSSVPALRDKKNGVGIKLLNFFPPNLKKRFGHCILSLSLTKYIRLLLPITLYISIFLWILFFALWHSASFACSSTTTNQKKNISNKAFKFYEKFSRCILFYLE